LHARIAQAIEETFSDIVDSQPEVLARHRTEAGLKQSAMVHWQRAGELALRRSAGSEALKHFSRFSAAPSEDRRSPKAPVARLPVTLRHSGSFAA
jgi:predicted ATPase